MIRHNLGQNVVDHVTGVVQDLVEPCPVFASRTGTASRIFERSRDSGGPSVTAGNAQATVDVKRTYHRGPCPDLQRAKLTDRSE